MERKANSPCAPFLLCTVKRHRSMPILAESGAYRLQSLWNVMYNQVKDSQSQWLIPCMKEVKTCETFLTLLKDI